MQTGLITFWSGNWGPELKFEAATDSPLAFSKVPDLKSKWKNADDGDSLPFVEGKCSKGVNVISSPYFQAWCSRTHWAL